MFSYRLTLYSEKKIDTIQQQTNQIVQLLSRLTSADVSGDASVSAYLDGSLVPSMNPTFSRAVSEAAQAASPCSTASAPVPSQAQFEGESSLSAHTAFANSLIERAVSTAPLENFSTEMGSTLEALHDLIESQKAESNAYETTYRLARPDPHAVLPLDQNPMPPINSVMTVLQLMKSKCLSST